MSTVDEKSLVLFESLVLLIASSKVPTRFLCILIVLLRDCLIFPDTIQVMIRTTKGNYRYLECVFVKLNTDNMLTINNRWSLGIGLT